MPVPLSRLALTTIMLLIGCEGPEAPFDEAAHRAQVASWRDARDAGLRQPDGWLSLAGLYWLEEGPNTFGSDPGSDLVFPDGAPARLGTFTLQDSVVHFEAAPGAGVTHEGVAVDTLTLASDASPDGPTLLSQDRWSWYVLHRDGRYGVRLRDREASLLTTFEGMDTYAIDPGWRIVGRFERYDPPRTIAVPTILGTDSPQTSPGAVVFEKDGAAHRLDVTGAPGDSSFFVIFGDPTNGRETYEAGRYLYVDAPEADGRIVIDFNKAYNPPCVFTPYATCPFPPPQNRLKLRIEAGEKKFAHP